MDGRCAAGVSAFGLFLGVVSQEPPETLLTIPQRDTLRSWSDEPSAAVSADGQSVVFASYARLAPGDLDSRGDIYVLDRVSGHVTLESVTAGGGRIGSDCVRPGISRDGRYLVFDCTVSRDGQPPAVAVVLRDRWKDVNKVIAGTTSGVDDNAWTADAAISEDGRVVVFESTMTDLVAGRDENSVGRDIYLFDVPTGVVRRVSLDSAGRQASEGSSFSPAVNADGRYVAFTSTAELDGDPDRSGGASAASRRPFSQVYVRDTHLNVTRRVSVCPRGAAPNGRSWHPAISGDGRYVAFVSDATNLVPGDRNRLADVFLYDTSNGSTVLVSRSVKGSAANGASALPAISSDGEVVAFQSDASDLVCARQCGAAVEDINLLPDVFLFDRATAAVTRISSDRTGGWMAPSVAPALDASGRVVTFTSRHPTDASDDQNDFDLFVRVPR
jgi:Tol biopolymer transport system component